MEKVNQKVLESTDQKLDKIMKAIEVLTVIVEDAREDQKLVNEEIFEKLGNLTLSGEGFTVYDE